MINSTKHKNANLSDPLAVKGLAQITYNKMKEMMFSYRIVPGQRLILVDLAKQLSVSRTPINIALSILHRQGFLDFVPNQGYRVHEITREEMENLYYVRKILELGAVEKAIERLNQKKLSNFKKKKDLYEKAVTEHVSRGRFILDQEFHASLIKMGDNPYHTEYFRDVYQRIFLRHRIDMLIAERATKVAIEHNEIFDAISRKDVRNSKKLIRNHIRTGMRYIISSVFYED